MKKADFIIIVIFLAAAIIALTVGKLVYNGSYDKKYVAIYTQNKLYKKVPIPNSNFTDTIKVKTELGENIIAVKDGGAIMLDADCHDKVCVKSGFIGKPGQTIVCLPHKLVVEIQGQKKAENKPVTDDVSY